jgi:hypothetical protein
MRFLMVMSERACECMQGGNAGRDALVHSVDHDKVAAAEAVLQRIAQAPGM